MYFLICTHYPSMCCEGLVNILGYVIRASYYETGLIAGGFLLPNILLYITITGFPCVGVLWSWPPTPASK